MILAGFGDDTAWMGKMDHDGQTICEHSVKGDAHIPALQLQSNQSGNIVMRLEYAQDNDEAVKNVQYYVVPEQE